MPKLEVVARRSDVWSHLREAAEAAARAEPHLATQMNAVILSHADLAAALSFQIARKLGDNELGGDGGSLLNFGGLRYTDECFDIMLFAQRTFFVNRDIQPDTTIELRFRIATFN